MSKILLVEDEVNLGKLIVHLLHESGYESIWARTLAEAMTQVALADLVLLDLNLPDSSGLETLVPMRAACPFRVPILILSGHLPDGDVTLAIELGADDVLEKPFTSIHFVQKAIIKALKRARHPKIGKTQELLSDASVILQTIKENSLK